MSYYNKREPAAVHHVGNGEKRVLQALANSVLESHSATAATYKRGLEAGKKRSSATLLRNKLKGHLVREFNEI